MRFVRALVVVVLFAVVASPLTGVWSRSDTDATSVFAQADQTSVRGRHDENDKDKKDKNRATQNDEDSHSNAPKFGQDKKDDRKDLEHTSDAPRNPTNVYSKDNFELEGNVVRLNCDASPKEIVITTLDGEATLFEGPKDRNGRADRVHCGELMTGDYVFVHDAQKRNEQAYDAYYISCQQQKQEGPDNSNDNDGNTDPNCLHIWFR